MKVEVERISKVEQRLDSVESDLIKNSQQHKEFYEALQNNAINAKEMEVNLKYLRDGMVDIQKTLAVMSAEDGNKWKSAKSDIFKTALTILVTAITVGILSIIKIKG